MCQEWHRYTKCYFLLGLTAKQGKRSAFSFLSLTHHKNKSVLYSSGHTMDYKWRFSFRNFKANISTFQMAHKQVFSKNVNRLTLGVDAVLRKVECVSWPNPMHCWLRSSASSNNSQRRRAHSEMSALCSLHTSTEKSDGKSLRSALWYLWEEG